MASATDRIKEAQRDIVFLRRLATKLRNERFTGRIELSYTDGRITGIVSMVRVAEDRERKASQ